MPTNSTSSGTAVLTLPSDTQILVTREFDAPKHLVYKAYTTPELIERWWTAKRGTMKVCEVDLRVGGRWRYVMDADGGFEVAFHGEYEELVPNERIVSTETFEGAFPEGHQYGPGDYILNTLTLVEADGRTTLTLLSECSTQEIRDTVISSGMEDGMQDAYDLLEQVAVSLG
ncbi:MAG: SRPBCC family protein [Actinomycetota bacterium]